MIRAISQIQDLEKKLFWLMLAVAGFLALLYVYLINNTILNVVARKDAYEAASNLSATVSELEGRYVLATSQVTLDKAHDLGFSDAGIRASFAYIGGQGSVSMR